MPSNRPTPTSPPSRPAHAGFHVEKETGNSIDRLVRPGPTAARFRAAPTRPRRRGLQVSVPQPSTGFGEELRKRRLEAGLSLTALSSSVHYSKAQLSKVERGLKAPSRDLARLLRRRPRGRSCWPCSHRRPPTCPSIRRRAMSTRRTGSCSCRRTARTPSSPWAGEKSWAPVSPR
ncbi:helix-turn-helix domain-containing protein [Streptomyces antimycoticus]|uniref:helix-turn-helix domain-containing protein n=1 Tax=Streptomyces antimycoticus TaxID=68175 RepID=UPI00256FAC9D|nr:helix-turn-helix transcriptional regulator [Streptomyces antimycoticus]WJE01960.1 helix-turn-helix transcriptional regulator [Streptomyces antimycoticus]